MPKYEINIKAEAKNAIALKAIEKVVKKVATIPADDLERIGKLLDSPKALKALKDNWEFLQTIA